MPSYQAILAEEGAGGPEEVAIVGDEAARRAGLERLAAVGVTDFNAVIFAAPGDPDSRARAHTLLASLAEQWR